MRSVSVSLFFFFSFFFFVFVCVCVSLQNQSRALEKSQALGLRQIDPSELSLEAVIGEGQSAFLFCVLPSSRLRLRLRRRLRLRLRLRLLLLRRRRRRLPSFLPFLTFCQLSSTKH